MYFLVSYDVFHASASVPLPLENVLSAGITAGSALFPMYLSEKTKHGIARRCTSSPRYTNARFLGSLAAVGFLLYRV
jgi:hypothetical protein